MGGAQLAAASFAEPPATGKAARFTEDDVARALALEKSLFGEEEQPFARHVAEATEEEGEEDTGAGKQGAASVGLHKSKKGKRAAVWADPDDEKLQVDISAKARHKKLHKKKGETTISGTEYETRLRDQHRKLNANAKWAKKPKKATSSDEEEEQEEADASRVLRQAGGLLADGGGKSLPSGQIDMTRCKDANMHGPTQGVVQSLEFHPNGQLLMTAGLDKKIRLFQVDGIRNPSVQTVHLEDCPVHQAAFAGGGRQLVAAGRRPFFYVYDIESAKVERVSGIMGHKDKSWESFAMSPDSSSPMIAFLGNQGTIPLVSVKSRQAVGSVKMSGAVRCASFSHCGRHLLAGGSDGMLYLFDIRMQRCISCQVDEGAVKGTAVATSAEYFAAGSDMGVVNLYSWEGLRNSGSGGLSAPPSVKPEKALLNLTTTIDSLAFSPDGAMLAMASRMKKDSLRLVHVPSRTVFSNWPSARTPLHYVHCLGFSPGGGYLAVGNAKGKVLLYRIHHYKEA
eukprot:CAMPEP_0117667692 /NCGR_PEP_ID=MMETSP0804-20121206/11119_1 /TAXON_ID=1074897 /ORGANISM="Tetraselmis astigmatica, Strain CCMP880" /LENGTH=509 /DNA_ID=CAMNT_0005475469 /DNA_START=49 /DNA_END=1578 /DNA_ORIENTATION=+